MDVSKISVFKNSAEFTKNTLILVSLCNKVAVPQPEYLLKKRPRHRYFFCDFCDIFKNTFFTEQRRVTISGSLGYYLKTYLDITVY